MTTDYRVGAEMQKISASLASIDETLKKDKNRAIIIQKLKEIVNADLGETPEEDAQVIDDLRDKAREILDLL